jgi:hypothetical protein
MTKNQMRRAKKKESKAQEKPSREASATAETDTHMKDVSFHVDALVVFKLTRVRMSLSRSK